MSTWIVVRPRRLPISLRLDRRVPLAAGLLVLSTLVFMVLNIGLGQYAISPLDVLKTLAGLDTGNPDHAFVVLTLRLPRVVVAWLVGAALGVAGNIVQGITRNPLASPELTGVTTGASLAAVTLIVLVPAVPYAYVPLSAFAGGVLVAAVLYGLAWRGNAAGSGDSPMRLILVGIGLTACLGAFITFVMTFGDIWYVQRAIMWLTGSVYATDWGDVRMILPWLAVGLPLALLGAGDLNALNLGEDVARGLGTRVALKRALLLGTAVALSAAVVTAAGTISFVGLIAPHVARKLVGPMHEGGQVVAALAGGLLVVASDLVGRTLAAPIEIPVGVIVALVGAPFFIYLLWHNRERM